MVLRYATEGEKKKTLQRSDKTDQGCCVCATAARRPLSPGEQDNGWKLGVLASTADLAKHTIRATIRPFAPRLAAAH